MTKMLPKRITKLLTPLKSSTNSSRRTSNGTDSNFRGSSSSSSGFRTLTVRCTVDQTTEDVLDQLQDVSEHKDVACVVLREMIQRSDNIQLFARIQDLLRDSKYFRNVRSIHLLEPHVHYQEYRRWCFKKTNFLTRIRKLTQQREIQVTIHGTLILDSAAAATATTMAASPPPSSIADGTQQQQQQQQQQNISGWLSLLQQLPQDPHITSIWIYLKEEEQQEKNDIPTTPRKRPSQLDLQQSSVQKIFRTLVELFNSDTRRWIFVNCHILYKQNQNHDNDDGGKTTTTTTINDIHQEQTQSLLDVAELFHIPLRVQWQPILRTTATTTTMTTNAAGGDNTTTTTTTTTNNNNNNTNSGNQVVGRIQSRMTTLAASQLQQTTTDHSSSSGSGGRPPPPSSSSTTQKKKNKNQNKDSFNHVVDEDNTSITMDGSSGAFTFGFPRYD